ncbi:MAG TPA: replication-relaxation family protein [Pirellulales bacterium]|nr:replication-relaxation family protein [Pirellulales bacterium]
MLNLQIRDIAIFDDLVRYRFLDRKQVQRLHFPEDATGRACRRRMHELVAAGYVDRLSLLYAHPIAGSPAAVFQLSRKGYQYLADHHDDERLRVVPTESVLPHLLQHWLALSETHIMLDKAISLQSAVTLNGWVNEYDIVNKSEQSPEKRYCLYTLIRENPRLVCAPDAGFLLSAGEHSRVYYVEQDRATSGVQQLASGKTKGYAAMFENGLHKRHFSDATLPAFRVLLITTSKKRRDNIRAAIKTKPGANLWWFASTDDLSPETFLTAPVWSVCGDDEAHPIIRKVEG